jgi:hypothetical protein
MSPEQCRAARERLKWSRHDLAVAADVPLWFIAAFEDRKETAAALLARYELTMHDALEAVGIGFPFEISDGRVAPAGGAYSLWNADEYV